MFHIYNFLEINRYIFFSHKSICLIRCSSFYVYSTRKFKFVQSTNDESNTVDFVFCRECHNHLTTYPTRRKKFQSYNYPKNTWPGFIWSMLSDEMLIRKYQCRIWQLIPRPWRYWWIDDANPLFNDRITLDSPTPIISDRTCETNEFDSDIKSLQLGRLRDTTTKHLMPCVLCPWGCTEFYHE